MGTEVGIFFAIVLILAFFALISGILLLGGWILFGSAIGFPAAVRELSRNWKKMTGSDKIKYICLILIGVFACLYAILYITI